MVLYLLLSILSAACLLIIFRYFVFWKIDTMHAIIVNYWTAAMFSFMTAPAENGRKLYMIGEFWYVSLLIGLLFIVVFFITAKTTQKIGVGVASVASKMSMVIPIGAGIWLYQESLDLQKSIGILLAIPAVILTSKPSKQQEGVAFDWRNLGLPVLLFVGAGLVDTCIKFMQHHYMNDDNRQLVIMSIFASAGLIGLFKLLFEVIVQKKHLSIRSIGGGLLLGSTNYFSLYFLLKCLESPGTESSTVFALVNIGVVITSFITGLLLFKETSDRNKVIGLMLSVIAILVLSVQFS